MDKNTLTGFVLIGAVLVGFSYFSRPSEEQIKAQQEYLKEQQAQAKLDSINKAQHEAYMLAKGDSLKMAAATDSSKAFFKNRIGEEKAIVLKNKNVEVTLNTLGGTLTGVRLLDPKFKAQDKKSQVEIMTPGTNSMTLAIEGKNEHIISSDYYWEAVDQTDTSVTMRLTAGNGGTLDMHYALHDDAYMTDFTIQAHNLDQYLSLNEKRMNILWTDSCRQQEKGHTFENRYSMLTYKEKDDDTDNLAQTGNDQEEMEEALDWVAFKNQFFSCVLIGHQDFNNARLTSTQLDEKSGYLKYYCADMQTYFDPTGKQPTQMQLYLGPNDYHLLQDHNELCSSNKDLELEELVNLGWPLFRWINRFFIIYVFDWLSGWGLSMGIVLLLLTLIIKAVVYPTTRKSYLSSARMRVLKPKVDAISQKYPNQEDAMRKQQEVMGLYREYGVSPMGGCLPMLIQMPIFIALFNFVPNAIQLRGESFLWADDLSAYDDLIHWGFNIPLLGDHLSIFCVLFCLTNIINTVISMRQQKNQMSSEQEQQMKMMRWMMYLMPVMFFFMFNDYSSGLSYYYFLSGLISILIMWFLRKTTDDKKLLAQLEAYREAHKNEPKKLSGFAARMAAMQQQQEMMRKMQEQQKRK